MGRKNRLFELRFFHRVNRRYAFLYILGFGMVRHNFANIFIHWGCFKYYTLTAQSFGRLRPTSSICVGEFQEDLVVVFVPTAMQNHFCALIGMPYSCDQSLRLIRERDGFRFVKLASRRTCLNRLNFTKCNSNYRWNVLNVAKTWWIDLVGNPTSSTRAY